MFSKEVQLFVEYIVNLHTETPVTSNPISSHGRSDWKEYLVPSIIVWDPLQQIFHGLLQCISCQSPLKLRSWKSGGTVQEAPRVLTCIHEPILLVGCVYACSQDHRFLSHDPRILSLCEEQYVPFVLKHKIGFTKKFMFYVAAHVTAGLNFKSIGDAHHSVWQMRSHTSLVPLTEDQCWDQSASRKTISDSFIYHYLINARKYASMMSMITGKWLSMDHTFKTAANIGWWNLEGKWKTSYDSVFLIMNEKKEVLSWLFTKSTGFIHVSHALRKIKERLDKEKVEIHGLVIDNCCQWRALLHSIFGNIPVKLDLFHGVKRVTGTISKNHRFYYAFRTDFRMVFCDPMDRLQRREMPTPPPSELTENLDSFLSRWQLIPGSPINKKTIDSITRLRKHITAGCLSYIPPGIGTNVNENIHKQLKDKLTTNRKGVQSALASFGHFFYDWNQRRSGGIVKPIEMQSPEVASSEVFGVYTPMSSAAVTMEEEPIPDVAAAGSSEEEGESDDVSVLGIEEDEIQCIKVWATHSSNIQAKLNNHPELNMSNVVFWSQFLHRLFELGPSETKIQLDSYMDLYGLSLLPENEDNGILCAVVMSTYECSSKFLEFQHHLKNIGIDSKGSAKKSVETLRDLLVTECTNNEYRYSAFFSKSNLNYSQWLQQLIEGDTSAEQFLIPAVTNVLQVPLIILTSHESCPVISVIPMYQTAKSLFECVVIIVYDHNTRSFKGVTAKVKDVQNVEKDLDISQVVHTYCRCGSGRNRGKENITSCDSFSKRCKCFQALNGCGSECGCLNCANPRGQRKCPSVTDCVSRKRQKTNIQDVLCEGKTISKVEDAAKNRMDANAIVVSVINFFMWNGISLDAPLIGAVTRKVMLTTEDRSMNAEVLQNLVRHVMKVVDANATLLDVKTGAVL